MKLRDGFVSNSSSSSFLIRGKNLTEKQRNQIENHIYFGKKLGVEYAEDEDAWNIIHLPSGNIRVWTTMNNFDFGEFLGKIGVAKWDYRCEGEGSHFWGVEDVPTDDFPE